MMPGTILDGLGAEPFRIELLRSNGTSDVERFNDHAAMERRYGSIVDGDRKTIFAVAVTVIDGTAYPMGRLRRDQDADLAVATTSVQRRLKRLCAGAQATHERRYGDLAIR